MDPASNMEENRKHTKLKSPAHKMRNQKEIQKKYRKILKAKEKLKKNTNPITWKFADIYDDKTSYVREKLITHIIIKYKEGNLLTTTKAQLNRWTEFFKAILNVKKKR